jgi:hypothetical protein
MATGGMASSTMRRTRAAKALGGRSGAERGRPADVAAGGHPGLERDLAEERRADVVGQRLPAAAAEQRVRLAVVAREGGHVLDHADDAQVRLAGQVGGAGGDLLRADRRGRHDDHLRPGSRRARPIWMSPVPGGRSISR